MPKDTVEIVAEGLAQAEEARSRVVAAFERLSQSLGGANESLGDVGGAVKGLGALLSRLDDPGTQDALAGICEEIAQLLATQAKELAQGALAEGLDGAFSASGAILRETRQLAMVATMSRITGNASGMEQINGFVASLRHMTEELRGSAGSLESTIQEIRERRDAALRQIGATALSAAEAQSFGGAARARHADIHDRNRELSNGLDRLAERLEATSRTETGALIAGIQHADELSQRLDHVGTILSSTTADPVAARALASAQIAAACADTDEVLRRLRTALSRMRENGRNAAQMLAGDIGGEAEALIEGLSTELAQAERLERLLGPALAAALEAAGAVRTRVSEARSDFARLLDTAEGITLASINAGLLADRSGMSKAAMDVLSRTVQETAARCSAQADACKTAFSHVDALIESATLSRLEDRAAELHQSLAAARARHDDVAKGVSDLAALRDSARADAATLSNAVEEGLGALAILPEAVEALRRCGRAMEPATPLSGAALESLAPLNAIYTMQSERDVHVGLDGTAAPKATAPASQSLDDILF